MQLRSACRGLAVILLFASATLHAQTEAITAPTTPTSADSPIDTPTPPPIKTALTPHPIHHANGKSFSLNLPANFDISVAMQGLHRVRFFAQAPDGRIFVTDMHDLSDNTDGVIYILTGFNAKTGKFAGATPYLRHLHNPNDVAFYTDPTGQSWIYVPLTDQLVRYKYKAGDNAPTGPPQVLAGYPAYGLSYKYGGWHLTRTVAFGRWNGQDRMFVSVGSSCNACVEKEEVRATISVMDPDGKNPQVLAHNIRNAVGLRFIQSKKTLYATNMGDDQLGDQAPDDTMFSFQSTDPLNEDVGWPFCYYENGVEHPDPVFGKLPQAHCTAGPKPYATFAAHSSPLGLEHFDSAATPSLAGSMLVALHGASYIRIGTGYRVVRIPDATRQPEDFITGWLANGKVNGRPCGILRIAPNAFLLTDDLDGLVYYIHSKS